MLSFCEDENEDILLQDSSDDFNLEICAKIIVNQYNYK